MLQILKNSITKLFQKKPTKKENYLKVLEDIKRKKAKLSKGHKEYKAYEKIENKIHKSMSRL